MGLEYPCEKFGEAVYELAVGPGSLPERMTAVKEALFGLGPYLSDIPDESVRSAAAAAIADVRASDGQDPNGLSALAARILQISGQLDELWTQHEG